jgi:hypothetical protein
MDDASVLTLSGVVLDSPDAGELAAFYRRLLGWAVEERRAGLGPAALPGRRVRAVVPDRAPLCAAGVARRAR